MKNTSNFLYWKNLITYVTFTSRDRPFVVGKCEIEIWSNEEMKIFALY